MLLFSFICIILLKILYALYIKLHAHTFTVLKIWGGKKVYGYSNKSQLYQGWGSLVDCRLWGRAALDMTEAT